MNIPQLEIADNIRIVYKTHVEKKITFWLVLFVAFTVVPILANENSIILGLDDAWQDVYRTSRISFFSGRKGFLDISLEDGEYEVRQDTDLLLHFSKSPLIDVSGNYTTLASDVGVTTGNSRLGNGAGIFNSQVEALLLRPSVDSLFSPGRSWGDFTFEFWLYPATLDEGQIILRWKGSHVVDDDIVSQEIRCEIKDRKVSWQFTNFFLPPAFENYRVELSGRYGLVPRTWHHHLIRYDSDTGLLEYLVDGRPQASTHTTASRKEEPSLYAPFTGSAMDSTVLIGGGLNGFIDELRFSESYIEKPFIETFPQLTGVATTRVFDLKYNNSRLIGIDADYDKPGNTDIYFFYRLGDDLKTANQLFGDWQRFEPGEEFPFETRGRYIQIMIELLPDGEGASSPVVSSLAIRYEPDIPPHPPSWLVAKPEDGAITLEWKPSYDSDVAGYLIYYGEKPGQYFGEDSSSGDSPIDAGNTTSATIEGLQNGRLYYFSVVAYDGGKPPHKSAFSPEAAARPSRMYR